MDKKYRMIETNEMGEEIHIEYPDAFIVEQFTPLIERIEANKPKLLEPLKKLKTEIGEDNFEKYFNTLLDIKKFENQMMITTDRNINRSIITRQFMDHIHRCFEVDSVRIVVQ
ncbi:hypothetical protein [uncultured Ilyobacter sp.]|jgi:hypothetical protein|uniref:hypothetical protein n=1 Tax=uncultured Ilyobacter sp. TaxID=544433 RepID=UPI0029C03185|nr:hypothetical protein [uncultured Ilyobacter sp.]